MVNPTQIYQSQMKEMLKRIFPNTPVNQEWRAITNVLGLYCPRIDIAVGPFAEGTTYVKKYDQLFDNSASLINGLIAQHEINIRRYSKRQGDWWDLIPQTHDLRTFNKNSRCFLAIEIENEVSRKHLLGGAVNACVLGRIGIVIGWTEDKVKAFVRLQEYWHFLGNVGKNTFKTNNLLILNKEQFRDALIAYKVDR